MTPRLEPTTTPLVVTTVVLAAIFVGAFALAGDLVVGIACAGIVVAYTLVVVLGRGRSGTLEALSGVGDERTGAIYLRALSFAGGLLIVVIIGWWLVAIATGADVTVLTALGAVYGAAFIAACAVLQRRS